MIKYLFALFRSLAFLCFVFNLCLQLDVVLGVNLLSVIQYDSSVFLYVTGPSQQKRFQTARTGTKEYKEVAIEAMDDIKPNKVLKLMPMGGSLTSISSSVRSSAMLSGSLGNLSSSQDVRKHKNILLY